jgi:hypothetical protein
VVVAAVAGHQEEAEAIQWAEVAIPQEVVAFQEEGALLPLQPGRVVAVYPLEGQE